MSMKDGELHVLAALGAVVLSAALIVPTALLSNASADSRPILADNLEAIEASLAYKKPNAPKQPQKEKRAPDPEVKPEGVSRDENKKVEAKKVEDKKVDKPSKVTDPLAKFHRSEDDDNDVGKPNETVGAFDGSEFGIGDVTKGDPYFQRLVVDLAWQSPELAKGAGEPPIGCIHLTADGKIAETKFKESSNDDIATLAEGALRALQKKRNAHPEEVPTHLLKQLTTRWVCFKFTVKSE